MGANLLHRNIVANNLAVDVLLANSPGNELCVLRSEVQHQDPLVGGASPGTSGGRGGGDSQLSPEGRRLLEAYQQLSQEVATFVDERFAELYKPGDSGP